MMHGLEYWTLIKREETKRQVREMRMLRRKCGLAGEMKEIWLRWYGHVE